MELIVGEPAKCRSKFVRLSWDALQKPRKSSKYLHLNRYAGRPLDPSAGREKFGLKVWWSGADPDGSKSESGRLVGCYSAMRTPYFGENTKDGPAVAGTKNPSTTRGKR
jgi:hypothetical protein